MSEQGRRIRTAREDKGWSQDHLGELVGTSQQNIGRIESGAVIFSRFTPAILQALGLATDLECAPVDVEDIASDALHLHHLLDVIVDQACQPATPEGRERISALLWIARDLSEKVTADMERLSTSGGST